jgi:hypothetical protein
MREKPIAIMAYIPEDTNPIIRILMIIVSTIVTP